MKEDIEILKNINLFFEITLTKNQTLFRSTPKQKRQAYEMARLSQ